MPSSPGSAVVAGTRYADQRYWLRYQRFFPGGLRVTSENAPEEESWRWRGRMVHVDRTAGADAPAKVIAVHGAGSYGRMLASYARLPALAGLEFIAPDLPGFGLTRSANRILGYPTWVHCVRDLVELERHRDDRPIVLFGFGIGGRLAYDAAALLGRRVTGVVATSLLDARQAEVRGGLAARPVLGRWSGLLSLTPTTVRSVRVRLRWLANVAAVANHAQFANLAWADPLGGGAWIPLGLVHSYLAAAPTVEPESFAGSPVLLAAPAEDRWTPVGLSRPFFDRIAADKRFALLGGAGHLPVEESGLADLDRAVRDFFDELGLW